jgi:hypothetical protein
MKRPGVVLNASGLSLLVAQVTFFVAVGAAQNSQVVATITVSVTGQAATGRGVVVLTREKINGQWVATLGKEHSGKTVAVRTGTYLLLRFGATSGAIGFEFSPPGILEPSAGSVHLPNGAIGMLRAIHPGTAQIIVKTTNRPAIPAGTGNPSGTSSPNWSGYAISGGPFTSITGQWNVPTISGDAGSASSSWIGIDGATNSSLIQVGTEQDWNSGILGIGEGASYYSWWEVLPAVETKLPNPVFPGNVMYAEITRTNAAAGTWLIELINTTLAWTVTVQVTYTGPGASAEWIEEAPSTCLTTACVLPLADYSLTNFDDESTNNGSANLTASESINMVQGGVTVSSPSDPGCAGFNVLFGGVSPAAPDCNGPGRDCSTIHCGTGLVCCDCTVTVCTTKARCQRMCSESRRRTNKSK